MVAVALIVPIISSSESGRLPMGVSSEQVSLVSRRLGFHLPAQEAAHVRKGERCDHGQPSAGIDDSALR